MEPAILEALSQAAQAAGVDLPADLQVRPQVRRLVPASAVKSSPNLSNVAQIIAVASGKGGVGKSTVAVNLAATLAAAGARVGVLDADIHGPSLPLLVTPPPGEEQVRQAADGSHNAVHAHGMACMSYGWVAPRNERGERAGAVMRGPMASDLLQRLVRQTRWGQLDYLVVDFPPGTGDIPITLGQALPMTAAAIVTTPHALAASDVAKGVDMFRVLNIPCLALVENMAWFKGDDGKVYFPFGPPSNSATPPSQPSTALDVDLSALAPALGCAAEDMGIPYVHTMPIEASLAAASARGVPGVLQEGAVATALAYRHLAQSLIVASERRARGMRASVAAVSGGGAEAGQGGVADGAAAQHKLLWKPNKGVFLFREISASGAKDVKLPPRQLRLQCRCATCVDEFTGEPLLEQARVPSDVQPTLVRELGNYAVAVKWSDGHSSSVYTLQQLSSIAAGTSSR